MFLCIRPLLQILWLHHGQLDDISVHPSELQSGRLTRWCHSFTSFHNNNPIIKGWWFKCSQQTQGTYCKAAVVDRRTDGRWGGCKRGVGWSRGVNYFQNKPLSVSALFFHFLICFGSCFAGILPAWSYSLGPLMKYSQRLWGDMRKVTWKVKRTKHGRRLGEGKFSYQTQLFFKGWVQLNPGTVALRLPVEVS